MALFVCFLWNCIKLAPLRAAWNVSPDAIISERMILFAHSSAKPPNQCDYSFWYFAWAHRSFLCSVHVHIHKDLLDSFLVSSSRSLSPLLFCYRTAENFSITPAWKLFSILLMSLTPETGSGTLSWPLVTCCMCCPASYGPQLSLKLRNWR